MNKEKIKVFADKVYGDMAGAMLMGMAFLGVETGLFRVMAGQGPMTIDSVTEASRLQKRYVEEWLKGMASAGYLDYDGSAGTFTFPEEHSFLLASEGTDHFMGGLALAAIPMLRVAPKVAEAFREGGGVNFKDFGADCVHALDVLNRGTYEQRAAGYWLKSVPEAVSALEAGGAALDVGCGAGRIALAIATAFPKAEVIGLDPDAVSIARATEAAKEAGLADRVSFIAAETGSIERKGAFELVTAFDCVHDFARPVETLGEMRALLKPGGTLLAMEPKSGDRLEDNMHALGTVYYGFSLFHCMTQSLANGGPGLGTCMGPAKTTKLLEQAGFKNVRVLDIRSQTNLFYAASA
jgi:ubiquinone/menaquinone biosynthesis C-methylase UbiE